MKESQSYYRIALCALLLLAGIWGCAAKPFNPPAPGEIPKGPGVFSKGDDGAVLYDSKNQTQEPAAKEKIAPPAPADKIKQPSAATFEEYEAYKEWLEWKKSADGSPDYEEFKQWQEWRQYQQWKKRQ